MARNVLTIEVCDKTLFAKILDGMLFIPAQHLGRLYHHDHNDDLEISFFVQVVSEIEFFKKLDHPHCHYLLGAKTSLDQGGILVLTEVQTNMES